MNITNVCTFCPPITVSNYLTTTHRLLVETMVMTGSDLCASTKPWNLQLDTVEDIYHEFYTQGDREMASGRLPVPIMNRFHRDEQAVHQVKVV